MSKKIYIALILGIIFISTPLYKLFAQTREDSISNIKKVIKVFSTEGVGYANAASKSWYAYIYLHHSLSNEELVTLTDDKAAEIRIYAFMALAYNNYEQIEDVRNRLGSDNEIVFTVQGCIAQNDELKSIVNFAKNWNFDNAVSRTLKLFDKDKDYKNQIYLDLINDRPIKRKMN